MATQNELLIRENCELKHELKYCRAACKLLKNENKKYLMELTNLNKLYRQKCKSSYSKALKIKITEKESVSNDGHFESHNDRLGTATIECLRRLDGSRRNDSTFVLMCMKKIYGNDIGILKKETACGRATNGTILSENRDVIESLFVERITNLELSERDSMERIGRLNQLINSAKNNLIRPKVSVIKIITKYVQLNLQSNCSV